MTATGETVTATEGEPHGCITCGTPLVYPQRSCSRECALASYGREASVDEEFGITLDPCEHPSINGNTCAACGETVDV